jgi:hypothetical protein
MRDQLACSSGDSHQSSIMMLYSSASSSTSMAPSLLFLHPTEESYDLTSLAESMTSLSAQK